MVLSEEKKIVFPFKTSC